MTTSKSTRDYALDYIRQGFCVVPIQKGKKEPAAGWKEFQKGVPSESEITEWFENTSNQLAIMCGNVSGGLVVFDFDGDGWEEVFEIFKREFPDLLESRYVITGSGKLHIYVRCKELPDDVTRVVRKFSGGEIELRANKHYVLCPPSLHPSGGNYRFKGDTIIDVSKERLSEIISWLKDGKREKAHTPMGKKGEEEKKPNLSLALKIANAKSYIWKLIDQCEKGAGRNAKGYQLGRHLNDLGLSQEEALPLMEEFQKNVPPKDHPYTQKDAVNSLESAYKNLPNPACIDNLRTEVEIDSLNLSEAEINSLLFKDFSDTENAERWVKFHGGDFLWVEDLRTWWIFDGLSWTEGSLKAEDTMKTTAQIVKKLALKQDLEETKRLVILKQCIQWMDAPGIKHALEMARSINYKKSTDFDTESYLFLCRNGVIDLRNGNFRRPEAKDYLHKTSNVEFDPEAACPRWLQFLNEIFPENDIIPYIQRWCGYTLTGETKEEKFLILEGQGQNGKSTLLEVLAWIMGDWGISVPFATFKDVKWDVPGSHHHADMAQLQGKRFIRSLEVKDKARLNIERLKTLTGRDKVSARRPYGRENIEFYPVGKIWLAVNHLPKIYDTTLSTWRRLVRVPFRYIVPEDKKDKNLAETLKAEGSGILNWMLQGCFDWQKDGLGKTPDAVKEATEEYQIDSTPIRRFINEKYEVGGEHSTSARDFYNEFSEWWKEEQGDIPPISKKEVGLELSRMGFEKKKVHTGRFWIGLRKITVT